MEGKQTDAKRFSAVSENAECSQQRSSSQEGESITIDGVLPTNNLFVLHYLIKHSS